MFEFENRLSKLKHEVLTEVAKLAMKDLVTEENIENIDNTDNEDQSGI